MTKTASTTVITTTSTNNKKTNIAKIHYDKMSSLNFYIKKKNIYIFEWYINCL